MLASGWSSEHVVAVEYRDLQTNAMAVDCVGKFALLASKRCIALVDLDNPEQGVGRISRSSKWEVTSAMWNPHATHAEYFVTASNQKVDLYRWHDYSELKQENSGTQFKAHTRAISDVDWSYVDPNYFATASVDTYVFLWDIRDSRRPALSLSAVAGATQVKWNKINGDVLATSHDGDLRIWDQRKGTTPVNYVTAHLAKIHGVDWSPSSPTMLATSSQDCTVKFWDLENSKRAVDQLTTGSPVWRARYTPFGTGLITVVVPQLRRGENTLLLWNAESLQRPVHTFVGHSDVILEFQWRKIPREDSDVYQLVTWSKDQSLRIWKIEPGLLQLVGTDFDDDEEEEEEEEEEAASRKEEKKEDEEEEKKKIKEAEEVGEFVVIDSTEIEKLEKREEEREEGEKRKEEGRREKKPKSIAGRESQGGGSHSTFFKKRHPDPSSNLSSKPRTLKQEFELLNRDIPNVSVRDMNTLNRKCRISATVGDTGIDIDVEFPAQYPALTAPSFDVVKAKNLDSAAQSNIVRAMMDRSLQHVKKSQACLEPCIRQLRDTLDEVQLGHDDADKSSSPSKDQDASIRAGSRESSVGPPSSNPHPDFPYGPSPDVDASVPFPRTSGARFCGTFLVIFQRTSAQSLASKHGLSSAVLTPPSLAALTAYNNLRQSTQNLPPGSQFSKSIYNIGRSSPSDLPPHQYLKHRKGSHRPRGKPKRGQVGIVDGAITSGGVSGGSVGMQHHHQHHHGGGAAQWRHNEVPSVDIFDASSLFPFDRDLAAKYVIDSADGDAMCAANAAACAAANRHDLAQLWSLVREVAFSDEAGKDPIHDPVPWTMHPLGLSLVDSMLRHLTVASDVQSLAMISCAFRRFEVDDGARDASGSSTPRGPLDVAGLETSANSQHSLAALGGGSTHSRFMQRSSSLCDANFEVLRSPPESAADAAFFAADSQHRLKTLQLQFQQQRTKPPPPQLQTIERPLSVLASPGVETLRRQCDGYKAAYAELLHRWKFLVKRCELLKCTTRPPEPHHGLELASVCPTCDSSSASPNRDGLGVGGKSSLSCTRCKRARLTCAVCRLIVKGLSTFCPSCAHGGHSQHMVSWFKSHDVCPTGCGCRCLASSAAARTTNKSSSSSMSSNVSSSSSQRREEEATTTESVSAASSIASPTGNLPWINW